MVSMVPLEPAASAVSTSAVSTAAGPPPSMTASSPLCPNCHAVVDASSAYCSSCGWPLGSAEHAPRYAPFWRRCVAAFIDFIIVGVAANLIEFVAQSGSSVAENVFLLLLFVYYSLFEASSEQATIGKRVMGLIVCGADGRRLTLPRAAIRTLAKALSLLTCGVGFIMPLLTPWKQALHDKLTDTIVVEK
jgi:uncharacterized RDD family membrane protein YckC